MNDATLQRLAHAVGIHMSYVDGTGVARTTSTEGLLALLRAQGVPIDRPDQAHAALASRQKRRAAALLDPVLVAWDGSGPAAWVTTSDPAAPVDCRLVGPDGTSRSWTHRPAASRRGDGSGPQRQPVPLPGDLTPGRHHLEVRTPDGTGCALLLAAPHSVHPGPLGDDPRAWAAFLPLHAAWHRPARGRRQSPIGNVGDLRLLADWAGSHGAVGVATLPLCATFSDPPADPSPYAPISRRFWNELHLDLHALPADLQVGGVPRALRRLRRVPLDGDLVDHEAVSGAVRPVLVAVASALADAPGSRRRFEHYLADHPDVVRYARFRAFGERHGRDWRRWPGRWRSGRIDAGDVDPEVSRTHEVAQWLMHEQMGALSDDLRRRGQILALDLPLGSHPDGYDVWSAPELYAHGVSAGAPPDQFFPRGQSWGFPPMRPDAGALDGWAQLSAALDHQLSVAGLLRIDHVMALHRLFWVPDGGAPTDGAYISYPADQLMAVLSLASHAAGAGLVGEDLGTVPPEVRELMTQHRLRGMYVAEFETTDDPLVPLRPPTAGQVASLATHDLPPFAGWWQGTDIDDRVDLGLLDEAARADAEQARVQARDAFSRMATMAAPVPDAGPDSDGAIPDARAVVDATLEHLGRSDADLVVVDVEDLWGETRPQNVPGTHTERPNWRRRARLAVDELRTHPEVSATVDRLDRARRAPRPREAAAASWFGDDDLHLFNEGSHFTLHDKLGAHPRVVHGIAGVQFAVWAPDAGAVSVVGSFNGWDAGSHPLVPTAGSGIWQGFIAGARPGDLYKYRVWSRDGGYHADKADPVAFRAELPPRTASVVWQSSHRWEDEAWMAERHRRQGHDRAMTIYEVHLGSWRRVPEEGDRPLTYREMAPLLAEYCAELGFTHVELLPMMEHPFGGSWGYQITGFFAPTSRYGTPDDFAYLVDHLHRSGIGVILDWVPSHFPSDEHGLGFFDGTYLYEHADPRRRIQPDWKSLIFNHGRREVQSFLISNARFWLDRFHIDGLRLDAVASMLYLDYSRQEGDWVPNEHGGRENLEAVAFLRRLNTEVYAAHPDVVVMAEESTAWPSVSAPTHDGGLGFGFKWDLGWMHDTLGYFQRDPAHRRWHHHELTFRSLYSPSEHFVLPLSHDEVVHGKGTPLSTMPGDHWQQFANLRSLLGYQYTVPGKPLLFMGIEIGMWDEWSHERSLPWHLLEHEAHRGLQGWVAHLNALVSGCPALHERDREPDGFQWVDADNAEQSVFSWLRRDAHGGAVLVVLNATPVPRPGSRFAVPHAGRWQVVANSDDPDWGGSDYPVVPGGSDVVETCDPNAPAVHLDLPPLSLLVLGPVP